MQTKVILGSAALAAFSMIPFCPAPPVAGLVITGLAAPLAGNLLYIGLNHNVKRQDPGFVQMNRRQSWPGVSDESVQQCKDSNEGKKDVKVTQTEETSYRIDNVTPECMNLATLFTEDSKPIPCGSACLQYSKLSKDDDSKLKKIINGLLK